MSNPIETNDPNAIKLLTEKIEAIETRHAYMKAINAIAKNKKMPDDVKTAKMIRLGATEAEAYGFLHPAYAYHGLGFPAYSLTSNTAEIRRLKQRIIQCQRMNARVSSEEEIEGVTVEYNAEEGRVRLHFPEKRVSKTMYDTLRHNGFVFARSISAFSRMWTNSDAEYATKRVLSKYREEQEQAQA